MFTGLLTTRTMELFGKSLASNSKGSIEHASLNNQPCQPRPTLFKVNSDHRLKYPLNVMLDIWLVEFLILSMIHMV